MDGNDLRKHTSEGITSLISKLETLEELLPSVTKAYSKPDVLQSPYRTTDAIGATIDALKSYRRIVERQENDDKNFRERELIRSIFENGVKTGIEQEQARVKEARKGRRGAKKV